jgi:hypothetical protein
MLSTSYLNNIIIKAQSRKERERRIVTYVENKMQKFDGIVALEVEQKKMELAPTLSHFHNNSIITGPCPHFSLDTTTMRP